MGFQDFFAIETERLIGYLHDLGVFIFSPRRYLAEIAQLDPAETLRRLAAYAAAYTIFEIAVLGVALRSVHDFNYLNILEIGLFETALGLLFLPSFYLVARTLRQPTPLKLSLHYSVVYRFIYLAPALLLYGLFIITEDYGFAAFRGIVVLVGFLLYLCVFPAALARTLKKRVLAILTSLTVAVAIFITIGLTFSAVSTSSSKVDQLSILFDPIGDELDNLDIESNPLREPDPIANVVHQITSLNDPVEGDSARESFIRSFKNWDEIKKQRLEMIDSRRKILEDKKSKLNFRTSKQLVDLRLKQLDQYQRFVNSVDLLIKTPSPELITEALDDQQAIQDTELVVLQRRLELLTTQNNLLDWGLLI